MSGAFALVLAAPRGDSCSAHGGAFATLLKQTVKCPGARRKGQAGLELKDIRLWIGKKREFEATFLKKKKERKSQKKGMSGHLCNIPITTRSGIEVEYFSPVAISLSQTINLVHSIFFWVDIHRYVCQKVYLSGFVKAMLKICTPITLISAWFP